MNRVKSSFLVTTAVLLAGVGFVSAQGVSGSAGGGAGGAASEKGISAGGHSGGGMGTAHPVAKALPTTKEHRRDVGPNPRQRPGRRVLRTRQRVQPRSTRGIRHARTWPRRRPARQQQGSDGGPGAPDSDRDNARHSQELQQGAARQARTVRSSTARRTRTGGRSEQVRARQYAAV